VLAVRPPQPISLRTHTIQRHAYEHDQIVPLNISSRKTAKLIKGVVEIFYPGLPHGLTATHADLVNRDLLAFCAQGKRKVA
jgi:hypothetical protein